uniref:Uncharacterized protein n=1 Tax=Biomphalaria glabrata TaxID=6526 RepID=A0A2C9M0T9_BIOGL
MDTSMHPFRLADALNTWRPDYVVRSFLPHINIVRQPVFSARLGSYGRLKRVDSLDSIITNLSLLSCSSYGKRTPPSPKLRRRGRRKPKKSADQGMESIWVRLASKRGGIWNKMFQNNAMHAHVDSETEIFKCLSEEEKHLVVGAGMKRSVCLKRCQSETRLTKCSRTIKSRHHSASGRLDCTMVTLSHSLKTIINLQKQPHSHTQSEAADTNTERHNESVWHEDSRNLDLDEKHELTVKVKNELRATTSALRKVTGYGEGFSFRPFLRPLEDYPHLVAEDYSRTAKFPHVMRISPHLSKVIVHDMAVRMGMPRYHEIRVQDMNRWNSGHALDRAHRNLKVFNWLHSLKEWEFDIPSVDTEEFKMDVAVVDEIIESVDDSVTKLATLD